MMMMMRMMVMMKILMMMMMRRRMVMVMMMMMMRMMRMDVYRLTSPLPFNIVLLCCDTKKTQSTANKDQLS